MNTKIQWASILRTFLTAIGSFLIGKSVFGHNIDNELWQTLSGILLSVVSTLWGIFDKTATIEMVQSTVRSIIVFAGGFLVAAGKMTNNNIEAILALIPVVLPYLQSHFARVKSNQLETGKINVQQLKK